MQYKSNWWFYNLLIYSQLVNLWPMANGVAIQCLQACNAKLMEAHGDRCLSIVSSGLLSQGRQVATRTRGHWSQKVSYMTTKCRMNIGIFVTKPPYWICCMFTCRPHISCWNMAIRQWRPRDPNLLTISASERRKTDRQRNKDFSTLDGC